MRAYEVMVILDPSLEERTVGPSLDKYLNVVRKDGGSVESVDVWGRRRMAYEIRKNQEGIYAVVNLTAEPATVKELDRQLTLNESVLRTKVLRAEVAMARAVSVKAEDEQRAARKAAAAAKRPAAAAPAAKAEAPADEKPAKAPAKPKAAKADADTTDEA